MLSKNQISEIREHLEKAQNPLFYYDNDCDGLCSFLIFRRFLDRGKGVAVRSFPDLNAQYARKAEELNADYVFVLDKPVVSKEFIEEIDRLNLPMVWIDHHDVDNGIEEKNFSNLYIYNPAKNKGDEKSSEPVNYWAYKITNRKEDLWLGVVGCIADHYLPDFSIEFGERYGEFWGKEIKEPFDAYYKTEIGRIAQSFNFGLKDSTTNIVRLQNFLIDCNGPDEVFSELIGNYYFRKKYQEIRKKYDILLEKAKKCIKGKMLFFEYAGDLSISADISNELSYLYPDKHVIVVYKKGGISNISIRGENVKDILERVLKNFENASGGGHNNAVGARVQSVDLGRFREIFKNKIGGGK